MTARRLSILSVSPLPPSPPRFGAQARMHGLLTQVARHHDVTAVSLLDDQFDAEECRARMLEYCRDVVLIRNCRASHGSGKRMLQLRSMLSPRSFERMLYSAGALQPALDRLLARERFDIVNLEFPYLAHLRLRGAPAATPPPPVVLDAHEIAYDLARQLARRHASLPRRLYGELNWRKLWSEERAAFRALDGVYACSGADAARIRSDAPSARTAVIPNAADVEYYQPRRSDPPCDGRTVLFFGLLSTAPNVDAVHHLVRDIWPMVIGRRPDARCKIIGARPDPSVLRLAAPRVEVLGFVDDLRPHLASAATVVVPLRLGGGTRLKIVEGMAMAKAIVSTGLGAEGIDATPERDILIADEPASFARSVLRLLDDADLRARLGHSARQLAVRHFSWRAAAARLETFYQQILAGRPSSASARSGHRAAVTSTLGTS